MPVVIRPINDDEIQVLVDLVNVDNATTVAIDLPLRKGRIMRHKAQLVSGAGNRIDTLVARTAAAAAAANGRDVEFEAGPIGTTPTLRKIIDEQPNDPALFYAAATGENLGTGQGRLYYRPRPSTGADNVISAEFMIRKGWP